MRSRSVSTWRRRRDHRDGEPSPRPSAGSTSRTSPRPVLRGRGRAAGVTRHPGLPRRSARHGGVTLAALETRVRIADKRMGDSVDRDRRSGCRRAWRSARSCWSGRHPRRRDRQQGRGVRRPWRPEQLEAVVCREHQPGRQAGVLADVMHGADVFIGVSAPDILTVEDGEHERRPDRVRHGQPRSRDPPGVGARHRRGRWSWPQRLSEPDQQRCRTSRIFRGRSTPGRPTSPRG